MTLKKKKTTDFDSDQLKHNHRDSIKGHRTRKHFLNKIHEDEAEEEIKEITEKRIE